MDEVLYEFAPAHAEGSATAAGYERDDLLEKRRPVMQRWAECIAGQLLVGRPGKGCPKNRGIRQTA